MNEDDEKTGEHEAIPPEALATQYLTYAENNAPEQRWRCVQGHEVGVKGPHRPPTIRMMMGDGTGFDAGTVCFACLAEFVRTHFAMTPVLPLATPEEAPPDGG